MKERDLILGLLSYVLLVVCSVVVAAILWNTFANGVLYRCTDPLFDVWPPFVHPASDDSYFVPKTVVLTIWGAFVLAAFTLPALVLYGVSRFTREDEPSNYQMQ